MAAEPVRSLAHSGQFFSMDNCAPIRASQRRIVLSSDAEVSIAPSGEKLTLLTLSVWPFNSSSAAPLLASHRRTVLSSDAETSLAPSGEKLTLLTPPACPFSSKRLVLCHTCKLG